MRLQERQGRIRAEKVLFKFHDLGPSIRFSLPVVLRDDCFEMRLCSIKNVHLGGLVKRPSYLCPGVRIAQFPFCFSFSVA